MKTSPRVYRNCAETILYLLVIVLIVPVSGSSIHLPAVPREDPAAQPPISGNPFGESATMACPGSGGLEISHPAPGLIHIRAPGGSFTMQLARAGRQGSNLPLSPLASRQSPLQLEIGRPGFTEWYACRGSGIEQGMTIHARPGGNGTLGITYQLGGDLRPVNAGTDLVFFNRTGPVLQYGRIYAADATGRALPAAIVLLPDNILSWQVDDRNAVYPVTIDPYIGTQVAILNASDAASQTSFGDSVSVYNDTAIVGSPCANTASKSCSGRAYIFRSSRGAWTQTAILNASDEESGAHFGMSVSLYNDTAVVGTPWATAGSLVHAVPYAGSAYVFKEDGGAWTRTAILNASDAASYTYFGWGISLYNDTVLIAAKNATVRSLNGAGQVYVFRNTGGSWAQAAILNASNAEPWAEFGRGISLYNDTAAVGANNATIGSDEGAGQAYIFRESGSAWTQTAILNASDAGPGANFGWSAAIDSGTVAIGAIGASKGSAGSTGQAYIFRESGGAWTQTAILNASDAVSGDYFGDDAAVGNGAVLIGAKFASVRSLSGAGQAYLFKNSGGTWRQEVILNASDATVGAAACKMAVSLYGNTAVLGTCNATARSIPGAGQAYVFSISDAAREESGGASADSSGGPAIASKPGTTAVTVAAAGQAPAGLPVTLYFNQVPGSFGDPPTVDRVTIVPARTLDNLEVTAAPVPGYQAPPERDGRTVAGFLSIHPVGVNAGSISSATITFVVDAAWLNRQGRTTSGVVLMRDQDGSWTALPTTYDGRIGTGHYFSAQSPGFSTFVVVVGDVAPPPVAAPASFTAAPADPAPSTAPAAQASGLEGSKSAIDPPVTALPAATRTVAADPGAAGPPQKVSPVPAIAAGISGCFLCAAALVFYRKRRPDPLG